jgi:hypothetical protein
MSAEDDRYSGRLLGYTHADESRIISGICSACSKSTRFRNQKIIGFAFI